jgi:hypothetical protein
VSRRKTCREACHDIEHLLQIEDVFTGQIYFFLRPAASIGCLEQLPQNSAGDRPEVTDRGRNRYNRRTNMPAKTKALLMNPGAVFCWSFVPLAVRFLSSYCPALFQALFRYLAALIVLWSFTVITVGPKKLESELPRLLSPWPKILVIALAN